tara:strand:- start:446 stop:2083 length:1638 start_codon:yes stop_codon:yes gene_type:complete
MKYINIKRYKFSTVLKNFNKLGSNFLKIFKNVNLNEYNFRKIYKYLDFKRFDFTKFIKYFNIKRYNFNIVKRASFFRSKYLILHFPLFVIFFGFLYLLIPTFYSYDKSNIENILCKKQNIECVIKGKINYSFYPTPRIKINDLIINDFKEKKSTLIKIQRAEIILSIKNLLAKEKHKHTKAKLNNFEINFDLKKLKKYKNILNKDINLIPIIFNKGKIIFFNGKEYVATISNANLDLEFFDSYIITIIKGKFLNDDIYINLDIKKAENKIFTNFILKMSDMNFLSKINFVNSEKEQNIIDGNFLVKKDKNRITGIFDFKDNELNIKRSNLGNLFLNGQLGGKITLLPYFDFNLDLSLNSINFTKLYNYFLSLDDEKQKNIFRISKKINGSLNLTSDKIYSSYNLVKSLESRIKFYNGNISIDQLLLNLGKLGATDLLGTINNDKKFTNFKFESNIFVDNEKKFLSKFGIYNKEKVISNLFISGNFDLQNIKATFYEISGEEKFNSEDVNYIEKEFNDLMLEDGYKNLFLFPKFKELVKSVVSESN